MNATKLLNTFGIQRHNTQKIVWLSLGYGGCIALGALGLQVLDYRYRLHMLPGELYISLLALLFLILGLWIGYRSRKPITPTTGPNQAAVLSLGITAKELQVLEQLAHGKTNKDIAQTLFVAQSTIKTHLIHLYQKLGVKNRTSAIKRARELKIIA